MIGEDDIFRFEGQYFETGRRNLYCHNSAYVYRYFGEHKVGRTMDLSQFCFELYQTCTRQRWSMGPWYDGWYYEGGRLVANSNVHGYQPNGGRTPIGVPQDDLTDPNGDTVADLLRVKNDGHLYGYPGRGAVEPGTAFWLT